MKSTLTHFMQGLLMGGSDAIPGVSGGTMALIVGIYRRLIDAISGVVSLALAVLRGNREKVRESARAIDWNLILPLGAGILMAFAVATVVIPYLLEAYPEQMRGLFFGLVAASVAIPWLRIRTPETRHAVLGVLFAIAAYFLVGLPQESASDPSLVRVFFSTSVAICAMILPGVSGAYLLHALGVYEVSLEHFKHLLVERIPALVGIGDAGALDHAASVDLFYGLAFVGGAVFGLGAFSKLLDWLLEHYHDATMAALTGLMAGGLRALWPWQTETRALQLPGSADPLWSVIALGLAGFTFIVVITALGAERLDEKPGEPNPAEGGEADHPEEQQRV